MKQITLGLSLLVALLAAGCSDPDPVELVPPQEGDGFEIVALSAADTSTDAPQVDSTAVLPADRARFPGYFGITRAVLDNGSIVRSGAASRVLLEDRDRPIRLFGRILGFTGIDAGTLTLNGNPMLRVPHRVRHHRMLLDTVLIAGVEYHLEVGATYGPGQVCTWRGAATDSLAPFEFSVTTPENITAHQPAGGSVVRRADDLHLQWTGRGNLIIVISGYLPASQRTVPLLRLKPRANTGSLTIPRRIMRLLPADQFRFFAFSFILDNRSETGSIGGFDGPILVQAASVYTTVVQVR